MKRVEVGIVTFGPLRTEREFTSAAAFEPPVLTPQADTPMGSAIVRAISMINDRKVEYRNNGLRYYRPWVFLITDGAPTDSWQEAAAQVREGESSKNFAFFAVGVQGADMETLRQISVREPLSLEGLRFREMFQWLSSSLGSVSQSVPGSDVPLAVPSGWTSV
jgi:uncharacterized protein YegL